MSEIKVKTSNPLPPSVQSKMRSGVPMHKALAGASKTATGPKVKVS